MSLRDELLGETAPQPQGYTLLVPPDWGRFAANPGGRDELVGILRDRFLQVSRPDLFAQVRSAVHRQWTQLDRQGAIETYMPVVPPVEGGTPMSIVTAPWIATGVFAEDVRRRASGGTEVEELDAGDGTTLYRWTTEREGREDTKGIFSREVSYVRPFPGERPSRGVLVMASIVHPGVEVAGAALDGFVTLADAIMSTFVWRFE